MTPTEDTNPSPPETTRADVLRTIVAAERHLGRIDRSTPEGIIEAQKMRYQIRRLRQLVEVRVVRPRIVHGMASWEMPRDEETGQILTDDDGEPILKRHPEANSRTWPAGKGRVFEPGGADHFVRRRGCNLYLVDR